MRVIAGTAKGRRLVGPSSSGTRPLSDRAREALFNILGGSVAGARFLDLFAGTGAVGVEALSRGAAGATFVENDRRALEDIAENLERTGFEGDVVRGDALAWVARPGGTYDLVFSGPPQWSGLWSEALVAIDAADLLAPDGTVITQLDPSEDEGDPPLAHLRRTDQRDYGRVRLLFHRR
jgi:16S rRNA (guanine(966)-N(2))-methyltransferase RsmD